MRKIVIIGAGGFGRECLDVFNALNDMPGEKYDVLGFVDEDPQNWGRILSERPVLGGFEWLDAVKNSDIEVICAVGSPPIKLRLVQIALSTNLSFCSAVHPSTIVTKFVKLGKGSIITAGCVVTNNIIIRDHVILNLDSTVGHDVVIEDFSTVSPGVHISGNVRIGQGCEIGTGAVIIPEIEIGEWSVIGAGAVVTQNVPPNTTVVGAPARVIKERKVGWQDEIAARGLA